MKNIAAAKALLAGFTLVILGACSFTSSPKMPEPIAIGLTPYEYSALMYVADDQGFFAKNGLTVTIRDYSTTQQAIDGLLNGEVDMAFTSEYAIAGKAFKKEDILIVGNIDKYQLVYLVGRKDKGIENFSDIRGKKVGLTRKTIGEFYLGRLLTLEGMRIQDVTLVDIPPSEYVQALTNGSVDALIAVNRIADQVQEQLGKNAMLWPAQGNQNGYYVLVCRGDWPTRHAERIRRFLKSLDQAEGYIVNHPAEAKAIVQERLKLDSAYMERVWSQNQFGLSLDQSLIAAMEDEARWMIENNLTAEKQIPDFLNYIYVDGLETVKPDAVNIIR